MSGFDTKFLDEVKQKNDIIDVAGKYLHLEQKGLNYWARCPFHHEKTASFCINGSGQFYYCFGCKKSGDVITFVMEMESVDFTDALKILADRAKIPLPTVKYDDEKIQLEKQKKERALDILRDTAKFYVQNLYSNEAVKFQDYLEKRKIDKEMAVKYGLGASLDFNGLPKFLKEKGYDYLEMVEAGVCGEKDGRYYDFLGGRFIIPLINQFNQVVAFSGRALEKVEYGKYQNTRETIVFTKGNNLFNINNVKKIKNERGLDSLIIVEGQLDCISLVTAGFTNAVSSMGTALTKEQVRMIKRYCDKVYISYDGDFAGQKASIRGLEMLTEEGIDVKVVALPEGKDPDEIIKEQGKEKYSNLLLEAKPLIDFKLDNLRKTYDVKTVDGKRKYTTNAINVIRESSSPAEQEDLLKTVREVTGFTLEALKRELYKEESTPKKEVNANIVFNDDIGDKVHKASRYILAGYLFKKEYAEEENLNEIEFSLPVHNEIKEYILDKKAQGKQIRFNDLYEIVGNDGKEEVSRIAGFETDENKEFNESDYFFDCVRLLKMTKLEKEQKRLTILYKQENDIELKSKLAEELKKIMEDKKTIKK